MEDFAIARTKMVDSQLRTESVNDYDILAVMGRIPREQFVPESQRVLAYVDADIPLKPGGDADQRYLMEAAPLGRLLQLAEIRKEDAVLDVGCGTGYSAAVISALAGSVVALESDAQLAAQARAAIAALDIGNVKVVTGQLEAGYPAEGPYDLIFVDGSVEVVPESFFDQLKEGGRLVVVVGYGGAALATLYTRTENQIGRRNAFNADVRPLPGFRRPQAFVF